MDHDRLTVHLLNRPTEIPRVAGLVEVFCVHHGLSPRLIYAVNVSLEELFANTMSYGYADDAEHEIIVEIWREDATLVIDVTDDARPFDPTQVEPPNMEASLEERPIGGLGIYLVRELMDQVEYAHDGRQNRLRLRKRIEPPTVSG